VGGCLLFSHLISFSAFFSHHLHERLVIYVVFAGSQAEAVPASLHNQLSCCLPFGTVADRGEWICVGNRESVLRRESVGHVLAASLGEEVGGLQLRDRAWGCALIHVFLDQVAGRRRGTSQSVT